MNTCRSSWKVVVGGLLVGVLAAASASGRAPPTPGKAAVATPKNVQRDSALGIERRIHLPHGQALSLAADGTSISLYQLSPKKRLRTWSITTPRRNASLNLLPSGRVLVWGGHDAQGQLQPDGLWFDPGSQALESALNLPLAPRASHTTTVLTDGRILFAGGRTTGSIYELWSEGAKSVVEPVQSVKAVMHPGHRAELQADGRVRLYGGNGAQSHDPKALFFDPVTGKVIAEKLPRLPESTPGLAGSIPAQSAKDVSTTAPLAMRFTQRVRMDELDEKNFTLLGPGGPTPIRVAPVGNGRLVFVTPSRELFPGTPYTLLIEGAQTSDGKSVPLIALDFRTVAIPQAQAKRQPKNALQEPAANSSSISAAAVSRDYCDGNQARALPCLATAKLQDGVWTPGRDSTEARWRVSGRQPKLMPIDIMASVTKAVGFTTLTGQILRVDGKPVANVDVSVSTVATRTDTAGRFYLYNVPAGRQEIYVDGSTANGAGLEYGQFVVGVDVVAGTLTQLPYTMYLPRITARDKLSIPSPTKRDTVLTHPDMPGLMVQIPAGTVIRDRKGRIAHELAIVPTPVNRAPFPVADNYPMYYTLEPGGAVIQSLTPEAAKGVRVFYPNYDGHPKGTQANFWIYDPAEGWRVYGKGRVTSNGKVFSPEAGVALHQTMGGSYTVDISNTDDASEEGMPAECKVCGEGNAGTGRNATAGDPIDLRTGAFSYQETDISVQDVLPISLGRSYRQNDLKRREFGISTASNYGYRLFKVQGTVHGHSPATLKLILPNGSPLYFNLISGGHESVWEHHGTTNMSGATIQRISMSDPGYRLTMRDGAMMHFLWTTPNSLQWIQDRYGNRIEFVYDAGLLTSIISPSGRYIDLEYDAQNRIERAWDTLGNNWTYEYNGSGFLETVRYPNATSKKYLYRSVPNASHQWLSASYDRRGNRILLNEFGETPATPSFGKVIKQTLADGDVYEINYSHSDGTNVGVLVTHPDGSQRRVVFDPQSKYPLSDTLAYGTTRAQLFQFERDSFGRLMARIDSMARRTEYQYNAIGQVTSVTYLANTPKAVNVSMSYSTDHRLTSVTDPLNHTATLEYANGCLVGIVNPLAKRTALTCNNAGQPTSVTDPLNRTTHLHYLDNDLVKVVDPLGRHIQFRYDASGRIISVEDAKGNLSRREYDAEGRVVKLVSPDEQVTEIEYDPDGNIAAVLMPHGNGITYEYDERSRVKKRTDSLGQSEVWTYTHMNRVESYTDRKLQTTSFQYDDLGLPKLTTYHDGSTISATYDGGNRLRNLIDSASGTLSWDYDDLDQVIEAVTAQGIIDYEYDDAGRRTAMTAASQPRLEYQYDNNNRVQRILQGSEVVEFEYDDADRLIETLLPNGIRTGYTYNNANQVTGMAWLKPDGALLGDLGYGYDDLGHQVVQTGSFASNTLPDASTGNNFDDNNRQTSYQGQTLTYDSNGNLTGDGARNYIWNTRNQLSEVKVGASTIASFSYDAMGRRFSRTESGQTTNYLYDELNPVQETQGGVVNPILTGLSIDERFARNDGGGRAYFLTDALGSTRALTNAPGNIIQRYDYAPYGQTTQTGSGISNPYQYTGRERDQSGMYYYRARYYSPGMGRFISEDSLGLAGGGPNVYAYVGGNPISFIDPLGLREFPAVIIEGGGGAGIFGGTGGTILAIDPCSPDQIHGFAYGGGSIGVGIPANAYGALEIAVINADSLNDITGWGWFGGGALAAPTGGVAGTYAAPFFFQEASYSITSFGVAAGGVANAGIGVSRTWGTGSVSASAIPSAARNALRDAAQKNGDCPCGK